MNTKTKRRQTTGFVLGLFALCLFALGCPPDDGGDDAGSPGDTSADSAQDDTAMMDTEQMEDAGNDTSGMDTSEMDTTSEDADTGGDGYNFRTAGASQFDQIDRLGMPAVSTALAGKKKDAYNEGTPMDDVSGAFTTTIVNNLTAIHNWFDSDLKSLGLTPCTENDANNDGNSDVKDCLAQTVGTGGPTVQSLVVPDTLTIDTSKSAGFPNGRKLADPVMDVTLAVILLDLSTHAPDKFATMPLNPPKNDVTPFQSSFPYLNSPHSP